MIDVDTFGESGMGDPNCSLREAIIAANVNGNGHEPDCEPGGPGVAEDRINLDAGTYTLVGPAGEDVNAGGDLDIEGDDGGLISIVGIADANGVPATTINANNVDRVFDMLSSGGQNRLLLAKVTLNNGNAPGGGGAGDGGAVKIEDNDGFFQIETGKILNSDAGHYGGAIFAAQDVGATVRTIQTEIAGNTADEGGGIWVDQDYASDFDVEESALIGNSAQEGGAIYLGTRPTDSVDLQMFNSTVSGNSASVAGGALAFDMADSGTAFFRFSTIANNTSTPAGSGGGIHTVDVAPDEQFVYFENSIIANNRAAGAPSNCAGDNNPPPLNNIQSGGNNIESANTCFFNSITGDGDLINTDPDIAPLALNPASASATIPLGGAPPPGQLTTRTHALYVGSPAINKIPRLVVGDCAPYDQRYVLRPLAPNGLCDIGAFEGSIPRPTPNVKCGGRTATIVGTNGKNKLRGTNGPDVIAGLAGNDTIRGRGGKDILCGGKGKDKLIGGKGKDKLLGAKGKDTLKGGPGKDKLKGGPGKDKQIQ